MTPDQAPVADFSVTSGPPGADTAFDASASSVRFGTIAGYAWDFGDGSPTQTTTTPTTTHAYAAAGTYAATVIETDAAGTSLPSTTLATGRTPLRHGADTARATRSVVVSAGPTPAVTLSATSLDFGVQVVGATAERRRSPSPTAAPRPCIRPMPPSQARRPPTSSSRRTAARVRASRRAAPARSP